ncbi:MAG: FAD-dependent oxidoreductase [Actinomycetota bacterium]
MIRRRDFLKAGAALGLTLPLIGCGDDDSSEPVGDAVGRVVVVGAGVAGLSAALLLRRAGIEVQIVEASSTHGGRVRHAADFVDFPISLGGQWLEAPAEELPSILGVDEVDVELEPYDPTDSTAYHDGETSLVPLGEFDSLNFVGASWFAVFDRYVVPEVVNAITFDTEIVEIDHGGDAVRLVTADGSELEADRVIVTVPLRLLQEERLRFRPALPRRKQRAIDAAAVWGGIKAFFEFDEAFYPSWVEFADSETRTGQRYYFDAAYGQDSEANVLGLFAVGSGAEPYQAAEGDGLRDLVLAELDEVFDGAASASYLRHIVQDWDREPFIGQAYLADTADWRHPPRLQEPVGDRVFFAGEAYTSHDDWGSVDDATRSARDAVELILRVRE